MAENKTRAELQAELDEERQIAENLQAKVEHMEALIEEKQAAGESVDPAPRIYHDPFDLANPHKILKHPEGKVLSWINPRLRQEQMGWQGWEPVTWDSEIGRNIKQYIPDPPAKMQGISKQDNYVRRGTDSVLSSIDREIWLAREQKRENKALRKQLAANATANRSMGPGVITTGDGVQRDPHPRQGMEKPLEPALAPGGHRTRLMHPDEE